MSMGTTWMSSSRHRGFSMIEVLVTLVVVAFGLLGFARLQVDALKNNRIAMQRSLAAFHAHSLIESMRANSAGNYNQDFVVKQCSDPVEGDDVAARDLAAWNIALDCHLSQGQGKVDVANGTVTITLRWKESTSSADPYITWTTVTALSL